MSFPEGIEHQAGSSYSYGDVAIINQMLNLTTEFEKQSVVLTVKKNGVPLNTPFSYGTIYSITSNKVTQVCHCHMTNGDIITEGNLPTGFNLVMLPMIES